jgi:uncharacterized Zn-finger protein
MQPETILIEEPIIACDGGGATGHPLVYLNLGEKPAIECPYCGRRFVRKDAGERRD